MAVTAVGDDGDAAGEVRIELGEGEDGSIAVGRLDQQVELHGRSAEVSAERRAGPSKDGGDRHALVADRVALLVGDGEAAARQGLQVGFLEDQRMLYEAADTQERRMGARALRAAGLQTE